MNEVKHRPPFPWFGGKSRVADIVWDKLGDVDLYVEPFFGSGAVLFLRPTTPKLETVNDKDSLIANFWRAVKHDPEQVAYYADNPVNEADLTARHIWLIKYGLPNIQERIFADPDFYDAKVAGWWVWGICCWIGSGWCSGEGKWTEHEGKLVDKKTINELDGVSKQRLHVSQSETGINAIARGVNKKRPHISHGEQGVNAIARGANKQTPYPLIEYFNTLSERLRFVRVCCGDWSRVVTKGALDYGKSVGIFLDPPYKQDLRDGGLYNEDADNLSAQVRKWCIENSNNPRYRIALCGYEGEHNELEELGWKKVEGKAIRAYGNSKNKNSPNAENRYKERIWFNPNCINLDNQEE